MEKVIGAYLEKLTEKVGGIFAPHPKTRQTSKTRN